MGEPGRESLDALRTLAKRQFPAAEHIEGEGGRHFLLTRHGEGASEHEMLRNALRDYRAAAVNGRMVRTMLKEIVEDLSTPGMGRERHDLLQESLTIVENAINDGVMTGVLPALEVPSLTREVLTLQRRVSTRLGMSAQNAAEYEKAKRAAKAPTAPFSNPNTLEAIQHLLPRSMRGNI